MALLRTEDRKALEGLKKRTGVSIPALLSLLIKRNFKTLSDSLVPPKEPVPK